MQDRIRNCGGIPVLMNLCVVDERNPCQCTAFPTPVSTAPNTFPHADLREHAIFALHNLLKDNQENQAVLNAVKPSESWDENGILQK